MCGSDKVDRLKVNMKCRVPFIIKELHGRNLGLRNLEEESLNKSIVFI